MNLKIKVNDLDCIDCARALEHVARSIDGVEDAEVSFALSTLELRLKEGVDRRAVVKSLRRKGYEVFPLEASLTQRGKRKKGLISRRRLVLTTICGILLLTSVVSHFIEPISGLRTTLLVLATIVAIPLTLFRGINAIRSRSIDMNVLMSIAIVAGAAIGEWAEAAMVAFLFSIAVMLEASALARTRRAIESLMELSPDKARVMRKGIQETVNADEVKPGEVIVIRPGERIPLEGKVIKGTTSVDESAITGEPMPVTKQPGSMVFAGTLNEEGAIEVKVTKAKSESTLARIIHLVEHVEEKRAKIERFVDRFAKFYTPAVVSAAIIYAIVPYAIGREGNWIYRSLVFLIIACPCSLVIATPVAVVSGLASAAKKGILIKGGAYIEEAAKVTTVALDKTGTVTEGRPRVTHIVSTSALDENSLLALAASIEMVSNHPLAGAILAEARRRRLHPKQPQDAKSMPGIGMSASVDGKRYYVAKPEFFTRSRRYEIGQMIEDSDGTLVGIGSEKEILGYIYFEDRIRPGAKETTEGLRSLGMSSLVLLTGDSSDVAQKVASHLGIDECYGNLLPHEKVELIEGLRRNGKRVAMVGDGVNDAPALAASDVGIAMGAAGSDAAINASDVALMSEDITRLLPLFRISRRVRSITIENIVIAIGIKSLFVMLAAAGSATMWMAVFADMGASLIVITNALRLVSDRVSRLDTP